MYNVEPVDDVGVEGVWKLVISQNRPTGWIGFASKAQPATKGFFSLIITSVIVLECNK